MNKHISFPASAHILYITQLCQSRYLDFQSLYPNKFRYSEFYSSLALVWESEKAEPCENYEREMKEEGSREVDMSFTSISNTWVRIRSRGSLGLD
ncbi:unnamed protein product [Brugia timori]|uniref:RGS domain-containing protein n=1 Tax=Brugia timori TaxID=42155 RepID=A0A0R3R4W0_9BILA|nr:unnamed protein product [Brugia timori]